MGKVTAAVEPAVLEVSKLWQWKVNVDVICSEAECGEFLVSFNYIIDDSLILSPPKNCELKSLNYTLSQLFLSRVNKHVNNIIRHKVRCSNVTCGGFAKHTGITSKSQDFFLLFS